MTKKLDEPFKISKICRKAWHNYVDEKITKLELLKKMEELKNKQLTFKMGENHE